MTNTEGSGVEARATSSEPSAAATFVASWGALAEAARAALSMIPTSEEGRIRQEPLVLELERAAGLSGVAPHEAVSAGARHLVETTLRGCASRRARAPTTPSAPTPCGVGCSPTSPRRPTRWWGSSCARVRRSGRLSSAPSRPRLLAREVLADETADRAAGASR